MSSINPFLGQLKNRQDLGLRDKTRATIERMLGRCFTQQLDFIHDPHRFKACLCPRRSGKSYADMVLMVTTALAQPRSLILFLCLTKPSARQIIWENLKVFCADFEVEAQFHETTLEARFPNGSTIVLSGAETPREVERLRGPKWRLVVIDECKSFPGELLRYLVSEVIGPALNDLLGTLVMTGTPGHSLAGPFYEATRDDSVISRNWNKRADWPKGKRFNFSLHSWHVQDNVAMPHLWQAALADKEANGWGDDNPIWLREYLGKWCPTENLAVYRYNDQRNGWTPVYTPESKFGLPEGHDWKFVLGMDLGFEDAVAIEVAAYCEDDPTLYHVDGFRSTHLTIKDIVKEITKFTAKFGKFEAMVVDQGGLGKLVVETLAQEHGLPFIPAEKKEKFDHIELLNSDLVDGRVKIVRGSDLERQMMYLQWLDEERKKEDKSGFGNDCTDAFLYLWRYAYHHLWEPKQGALEYGSESWLQDLDQHEVGLVLKNRRSRKELDQVPGLALDIDAVSYSWSN